MVIGSRPTLPGRTCIVTQATAPRAPPGRPFPRPCPGYIPVMDSPIHIALHRRLHRMRDQSIRQPGYRQVYAHPLMVAHMSGKLVAVDDPALQRIREAIRNAREGDPDALPDALDTIARALAKLGA